MTKKSLLIATLGLLGIAGAAALYGQLRWNAGTTALRQRLEAARLDIQPKTFNQAELEGLPPPVQRYFRSAIGDRQPLIAAVHMELARGELMRFFAEAAWYPTALLPSQGVRWESVDEHSARATLSEGDLMLTLLFRFGSDGLIESVRAEARGRTVGESIVPTPWQGRFWNYASRDGMRVPMQGELAWLLPEGVKPYWRGRISAIRYEFARQ